MKKTSQNTKRSSYSILEYTEKPVTKKSFLKSQKAIAIGDSVSRVRLLEREVFTKKQMDHLVKQGVLVPIKYRSRVYFDKRKVLEILGTPARQSVSL